MKKRLSKGFTLIELLVVIAIIGVLSSIIMISLGSARDKSTNTSVKSQLVALRAQASLYYNITGNGSYTPTTTGLHCTFSSTSCTLDVGNIVNGLVADSLVASQLKAVAKISGSSAYIGVLPQSWAAWGQLKNGGFWCVDSAGASISESTYTVPSGAPSLVTVCPQ